MVPRIDFGQGHDPLFGQTIDPTVPHVSKDQATFFHGSVNTVVDLRVASTPWATFLLERVHKKFAHNSLRVFDFGLPNQFIAIVEMDIVIFVIGQEHQFIAPIPAVVGVHILADFVHHGIGLLDIAYRQAANAQIHAVPTAFHKSPFAWIHQSIESIGAIGIQRIKRIGALVGWHMVELISGSVLGIVGGRTHQKQVAGGWRIGAHVQRALT